MLGVNVNCHKFSRKTSPSHRGPFKCLWADVVQMTAVSGSIVKVFDVIEDA